MSKFKRLNLAESEEYFPLLNEDARKTLKGGCDGCPEWIVMYPGLPIYTEDEYLRLSDAGEWTGGLVCGFGYMLPEAVVYANMGYCGRHQEYYQDGLCYSCYLKDHYCDFHQVYFCYDCNQPGGTMGGGETGGDGNTGGGDSGGDIGDGSTVIIPPGGNPGYDNTSGTIDFQSIVNENVGTSFGESDKALLVNVLDALYENKVGKFILQLVNSKDCWMKFEIGDTIRHIDPVTGEESWSPAIYNKATNTITFRSPEEIVGVNLSEELSHAVQRSMYEDEMTNKNPNYEFEAKIVTDVIMGLDYQGSHLPESLKEDYMYFIDDIKTGNLSVTEIDKGYKKYYHQWNDPNGVKQKLTPDDPYYVENEQDNTFDPQLLKLVLDICKSNK